MNRKDLQARLDEQVRLGFPNFKNKIANILACEFGFSPEESKQAAFDSQFSLRIDGDPVWAQHMGPEYWAEVIAQNKSEKLES